MSAGRMRQIQTQEREKTDKTEFMRKMELIILIVFVLSMMVFAAFFATAIDPDRHESDPEVYERYVEDMRAVGRKPNGEPLDAYEKGGE